jgi:pyruvate kinase
MRNAKIVCTLGPASSDRATIRDLADAGMSVARLNASHGTTAERATRIERVQSVAADREDPLATMLDLRGPEVRTAGIDDPIEIATGSELRFVEGTTATTETVGLNHSIAAVGLGDTVLLDDGRIEATVTGIDGETVVTTVDSGGRLGANKSVIAPGVDFGLDIVRKADRREIEVAAEHEVDFVAASFVRDADDVYTVVDAVDDAGGGDIDVVAKIERAVTVENVEEVVDAADGVMVARGDLGVECPLEAVPLIQKRIVRRCMEAGVPVITATEMLDSMVHASRPTRAEASDVANAVLDGTDAVMLSAETAIGDHPVEVVETMARIVREIEASEEYDESREQRIPTARAGSRTEALARSARYLAADVDASAIVAVSESGYTVRRIAKFRPGVPIIATTPNERVRRQLAVSCGVDPHSAPPAADIDEVLERAVDTALDSGLAESGDTIVVLSGMMSEMRGTNATNTLKVHTVTEPVATGKPIVSGRAAGPVVRLSDGDLAGIPADGVLVLPAGFDAEFTGDVDWVAAIVATDPEMTGYPAIVARELGVPMVAIDSASERLKGGRTVTVDGERGVVYDGDVMGETETQSGSPRD